ncbi:WD40/YVTN/BNR-like repeat-containing protein [Paenibacillus sp. HW567]|uniref:WD40/YVTN/BNR-like repeat-containing protein n=1 Tax=Paenibacillus sp. HW567 TaxID=1034769 RepID=UPI00037DC32D|nr:hypothetical protein [Paenibacillus sp. HW567]
MKNLAVTGLVAAIILSGCSESNSAHGSASPEVTAKTSTSLIEASPKHNAAGDSTEETFFLNKTLGWKAVYHFQGMAREDMELYQTKNAGRDWKKISDSSQSGSTLPGGVKSGFVFTSGTEGWITANAPWQGKIGLFKTNDGGVSWSEVPLIVPDLLSTAQIRVGPPLFLSENLGILLTRPDAADHTLLYITKDGGQSWKSFVDNASGEYSGITWSISEGVMNVKYDNKTLSISVPD